MGWRFGLRNANDAQAAVDTAEGALAEVHTLLLSMREIAVSAASDTNTDADRDSLQTEVGALETEITRIGSNTTWGGINLLRWIILSKPNCFSAWDPTMEIILRLHLGYVHATVAASAQGNTRTYWSCNYSNSCWRLYFDN